MAPRPGPTPESPAAALCQIRDYGQKRVWTEGVGGSSLRPRAPSDRWEIRGAHLGGQTIRRRRNRPDTVKRLVLDHIEKYGQPIAALCLFQTVTGNRLRGAK